MINRHYAYFMALSRKFLAHALVQLQSFIDHYYSAATWDVHLIIGDDIDVLKLPEELRRMIEKVNSIATVSLHLMDRLDFTAAGYPTIAAMNHTEFSKRARFLYIDRAIRQARYDAVCVMDADMFIVSPQFLPLLDLVNSTDMMITCNEKFKWDISGKYYINYPDGKSYVKLVDHGKKLLKMHCSVPLLFNPKKFPLVFKQYLNFAESLREMKGGQERGVGDIFCWNMVLHSQYDYKRQILSFPIEVMTQVHQTNMKQWTRIIKEGTYWYTEAGDQVFTIHGRVNEDGFVDGVVSKAEENADKGKIRKSAENIQSEWISLLEKAVEK